ncbi:hypothetical protein [Acinetobacter sp. LoGeW2-3]|uniref:hypothetical protein n=1 Tax=Acinetobacter sp. LoGeW2-3 TaxID=1808001 RepID=UPI0012370C41|nr:hypothetical protein [Acinetobacter sp. LoGeW2-3]
MSSPTPNNSYKELLGILGAITLIFILWISYPRFMQYMDDAPQQKSVQMVIPYTFDAMLTTEPTSSESVAEEKSKFQNIGDQYGTYGDSYGSLNTLFSGLAFAILIISLFMQRQELQAQRQELEAQRNEIKESNAIADKQREITEQQAKLNEQQLYDAKVQNFYTLLFKFLDEKQRKIDTLSLGGSTHGDNVFRHFNINILHELRAIYLSTELIDSANNDELENIIILKSAYAHKLNQYKLLSNEVFEYINFILSFIEQHQHLDITKTAIEIFISYQSFNEMIAMFFISFDEVRIKEFILKYRLMRKLNNYVEEDYYLALVDKTLGQRSYMS